MSKLADYFHPENGEAIPSNLVGARIISFGAPSPELRIEGGGLQIDYRPADSPKTHRIIFAFNELGMWVDRAVETIPGEDPKPHLVR